MINKDKMHRLMIQVSINQYEWLVKKAKELDLSISQLVRWLLNKKIKDINDIKKLENKPKESCEEINHDDLLKELDELDTTKKTNNQDQLPF